MVVAGRDHAVGFGVALYDAYLGRYHSGWQEIGTRHLGTPAVANDDLSQNCLSDLNLSPIEWEFEQVIAEFR